MHAILCAAMRSCFGGSTVPDERLLDSTELTIGAKQAANYISRQLRRRVGAAARRAPKQVITIPIVDSGFHAYFVSFQESCLWVHQKLCNESKEVWYSPYFQAGECLSRFETFNDSKNKENVPIVAGSLSSSKQGTCASSFLLFLRLSNKRRTVGELYFGVLHSLSN